MKKMILIMLVCINAILLPSCSSNPNFTVTYPVTGTEYTPMWPITGDEFSAALDDRIIENGYEIDLSLLKETSDGLYLLSSDGDAWDISISLFTDIESQTIPGSSDYIGYIKDLEVSTYASTDDDAIYNGQLIRSVISVFTPGAEEAVEENIGLYGDPDKDAIIADGVYRVTIESVVYTYIPGSNSFMVEPYLKDQPSEEEIPNVIKPN